MMPGYRYHISVSVLEGDGGRRWTGGDCVFRSLQILYACGKKNLV